MGRSHKDLIKKWEEEVLLPSLRKLPEREESFSTVSGLPLKLVYTSEDLPEEVKETIELPGSYPFTRGIHPTMYRSRLWTMRQYAGFGSAEETNERFHYLLKHGQTGLSVAFDLPTQMGYDSDHPLARGEVGKVGVAISTLRDMERLFSGIPLDKVSTSMTINATAAIILAMYCLIAEKQGVEITRLQGTIQNDILKEYVARGTYIFPPRPSMRLVRDIIIWCAEKMPKWNSISVSGYHIREAGANAIQEIAFTIADGLEYVKLVADAGLPVDSFAPRISFFLAAHSNILEEVAKFRAARRLWAKLLRERFSASDEACRFRFHTQTGGCTLTSAQPDNNIVRVAYQALAAVLGGTQSLHTNSRDEALSLPTEESVKIALRTQQILAYETGVADTVDPLGGSYLIENLTAEIEKKASAIIREIEGLGGVVEAIEREYIQKAISESAYTYQKELEEKKRVVVGVNQFIDETPVRWQLLKVDPELEERRKRELAEYRQKRNKKRVSFALKELRRVAEGDGNLMPPIIEAVRAEATVGEISDTLREVFGEYDKR
jgi:methylmalonyl-CoA mutase N-terminal domain/subunit